MRRIITLIICLISAQQSLAQTCRNGESPVVIGRASAPSVTALCPAFETVIPLSIIIQTIATGCFDSSGRFVTQTTFVVSPPPVPYVCTVQKLPQCTGSCTSNSGTAEVDCANSAGAHFRCQIPYTRQNCDSLSWSTWVEQGTCSDGGSSRRRSCRFCTGAVSSDYCPGNSNEQCTESTIAPETNTTQQNSTFFTPSTTNNASSVSTSQQPSTAGSSSGDNSSIPPTNLSATSTIATTTTTQSLPNSTSYSGSNFSSTTKFLPTSKTTVAEGTGNNITTLPTQSTSTNSEATSVQSGPNNSPNTTIPQRMSSSLTASETSQTTSQYAPSSQSTRSIILTTIMQPIRDTTTTKTDHTLTKHTTVNKKSTTITDATTSKDITTKQTPATTNVESIVIPVVLAVLALIGLGLVFYFCRKNHWFREDRHASYDVTFDNNSGNDNRVDIHHTDRLVPSSQ